MPKTILLADDSVTIQKVVGITLANEDFELVTVDDGDEAVKRARELRPDLVLADVVMPGRSGYEVCEAIRAEPELAQVPVLLLCGTFETFDEERAQKVGANGHLTKPFEAQVLLDRVRELLEREAERRAVRVAATGSAERPVKDSTTRPGAAPTPPAPSAPAADLFGPGDAADELDLGDDAFAPGDAADAGRDATGDVTLFGPDLLGDSEADEPAELEPDRLAPEPAGRQPEPIRGAGAFPTLRLTDADLEDPLEGLGEDDLGSEPVFDPDAAQAFDVSSADLDDPVAGDARELALETALPEAEAETTIGLAAAVLPRLEPELETEPALAPEPQPGPGAAAPGPRSEEPQPRSDAPGPAASARAEHPPLPREELRATLEKVAWEAFGDVSERVVREVVERIEAIAWEVIPQMAEVLIREEIARLEREQD